MVTHIVLFKFESKADAESARDKLLSMKGRVPSLIDLEAGLDFTRSPRSFDLGLITRHNTQADLEAYQVDPVHQEVGGFIRSCMSGAASVDFEA